MLKEGAQEKIEGLMAMCEQFEDMVRGAVTAGVHSQTRLPQGWPRMRAPLLPCTSLLVLGSHGMPASGRWPPNEPASTKPRPHKGPPETSCRLPQSQWLRCPKSSLLTLHAPPPPSLPHTDPDPPRPPGRHPQCGLRRRLHHCPALILGLMARAMLGRSAGQGR